MSGPPSKRRKMRPNNAIAVEKEAAEKKKVETKKEGPLLKKSKPNEAKSAPKLLTPVPTQLSVSDSDDTENEKQQRKTPRKPPVVKNNKKAPLSDSDSDETDGEKRRIPTKRKPTQQQQQESASGFDDTDVKSQANKSKTRVNRTHATIEDTDSSDDDNNSTPQQQESASDSDDTDVENHANKSKTRTHAAIEDSDSSDDTTTHQQEFDSNSRRPKHRCIHIQPSKKANHLVSDRISFRKKNAYDDGLSAANNVKGRLSDLFVPEVNQDYFISDSNSETDSGEDYDAREYSSWQRSLSGTHDKEKDPWPKQRKFGYSDKLKLEKRIKKICRREGIAFSQVQEIFSSSHRGPHIRFFQKIAKTFPDISLHKLAKQCKEMYHEKRNLGPWTEPEIKKLKELIKIHGRNSTLISEHMNRSPKNINDYLYNHASTDKKVLKRWSKEEENMLAKAASQMKMKDGKMSFHSIEPLFKETRTLKQIHAKYHNIRHLIRPDGTLEEPRKATPYEELKYLKKLLSQVREHRLVEESQLDYAKDRGFVDKKFYLKRRAIIKGFERMSIKDILKKLIEKQNQIIQSRREENLLESDPDTTDEE